MSDLTVNTTVLGLLFKKIGNFNNKFFINRLIMQKQVYLLQISGLKTEYSYYWYRHGVYSKELAAAGRSISLFIDKLDVVDDSKWNQDILELIRNFKEFVDYNMYEVNINQYADNLEVMSSIHYLDNLGGWDDKLIFKTVVNKKNHFTKELCSQMWNKLHKCDLMEKEAPNP